MTNILVVVGSARKGRVADNVVELVKNELSTKDNVTTTVADLKEINLPFFDGEVIPGDPSYVPTGVAVDWQKMVQEADGVIFATPEYNHSMSAIQKNAIDTLFAEWVNKPVAIVGYGWSGGSLAQANAKIVLENLKATIMPTSANLHFMKDLNPDGSVLDEASVSAQITATVDEVINSAR